MRTVSIDVPDEIKVPEKDLEKLIRVELALRLYQKGYVSLGQARRISNLSKWEFLELLSKEKIPVNYDENELKRDLKVIEQL
jgi:predicted HTH domain antitoxin